MFLLILQAVFFFNVYLGEPEELNNLDKEIDRLLEDYDFSKETCDPYLTEENIQEYKKALQEYREALSKWLDCAAKCSSLPFGNQKYQLKLYELNYQEFLDANIALFKENVFPRGWDFQQKENSDE